jgi:GAF domain-containing protein
MELLQAFAEYIGVAIENARSYEKLRSEVEKLKKVENNL